MGTKRKAAVKTASAAGRPGAARIEPRDWVMVFFSIIAAVLFLAVAWRGWQSVDLSWDAAAYHLPFAGLRTGIFGMDEYQPAGVIRKLYFNTFPVVPDYVKGLLWKMTSRVQTANLASLFALAIAIAVLRRYFRVPAAASTIAFLATPIVLIQASSCYNDLFANCFVSLLLLMILAAALWPAEFGYQHLAVALIGFGVSLNSKFQFTAPAGAGILALGILIAARRQKYVALAGFWQRISPSRRSLAAAGLILYFAVCSLRYVENWVRFGNPVYPVAVNAGPVHLPGAPLALGAEPAYLKKYPTPVRWVTSVTEYRAFEGRNPLWTIDQGLLGPQNPGLRIGGYFSAWVGLNFAWFCFLQWRLRRRLGWAPAVFFVALTIFTSFMPVSHELRYYMFWMLCLIAINLILLEQVLAEADGRALRSLYIGGALACLLFAANATGWIYLRPNAARTDTVSAYLGIRPQLERMKLTPGERICVYGKSPYTLFYAPYFNRELAGKFHYSVQEGYHESDCTGLRMLK